MGVSLGRAAGLIVAGSAVLILSFWVTLFLIDSMDSGGADVSLAEVPLTNDDGTPRVSRASTVDDLPPAPTGYPFSIGWDGLERLNALPMGAGPIRGSSLALSLVATKDVGTHRLGVQLVGVPANRLIQVTAWIKAPQGTHLSVDVRDGKPRNGVPQNSGTAAIDLAGPTILVSTGNVRTSVEPSPGEWVKVQVQMRSADAVVVLYLGILGPSNSGVFGGNGQQIIFGGIELTAL
jgi:hypothetical protein